MRLQQTNFRKVMERAGQVAIEMHNRVNVLSVINSTGQARCFAGNTATAESLGQWDCGDSTKGSQGRVHEPKNRSASCNFHGSCRRQPSHWRLVGDVMFEADVA
jgi:hypothetical protein